jgi:hypothetical protein
VKPPTVVKLGMKMKIPQLWDFAHNPVVLGKLEVRDAVIEVMALDWMAWVACCGCLGVVASYDPLQLRGWGSGIWLPLVQSD